MYKRQDNGTWVVHGEEIEKLFRMTKFTTEEGVLRFAKRLRKMGIDDKLEEDVYKRQILKNFILITQKLMV